MQAPKLQFDKARQTLFIEIVGAVQTQQEIDSLFFTLHRFVREQCGSQKVYVVIGYSDFRLPPELTEAYAAAVRRIVDAWAITIVRYSQDSIARATLRVVGIKSHRSSNVYATREEATDVVEGIRSKQILLE